MNGHSVAVPGQTLWNVRQENYSGWNGNLDSVQHGNFDFSVGEDGRYTGTQTDFRIFAASLVSDTNPRSSLSYTTQPGDYTWAYFSHTEYNSDWSVHRQTYIPLAIQRVNISSPTSAVPEPATWAMMIVGFGMLGGAIRSARHRQRESLVAA